MKAGRRVAIVGMGCVTPCGIGVDNLDRALKGGLRDFASVAYRSPRGKSQFGAAPGDLRHDPARAGVMALRAAREALGNSKPHACGLVLSTIAGNSEVYEALANPLFAPSTQTSRQIAWPWLDNDALALHLARSLDITGPRIVLTNACASGNIGLGVALDWIRRGRIEDVLVVGVDVMKATTLWGAEASGFIGRRLAPFDVRRDGAILGDGAAAVLLRADAALKDEQVFGWLDGFGGVCDHGAAAITLNEDGGGLTRAMTLALGDARAEPGEVSFISAHAPGTKGIDRIETRAIAQAFDPPYPRVNAAKSVTTHLSGASAVVEVIAGCLQLEGGFVHGNFGLEEPDPDLPVAVQPNLSEPLEAEACLSNACGGGGTNCSVLIRRRDRSRPPTPHAARPVVVTGMAQICSRPGERLRPVAWQTESIHSEFARTGMAARFAAEAGFGALKQAGPLCVPGDAVATIGGTALGGAVEAMEVLFVALGRDPPSVLPSEALCHGIHFGTSLVARQHELTGLTATVSGASLAGIKAFALACETVALGRAEAAICVVYDTADLPAGVVDGRRDHALEGAVAFVIETQTHAIERAANFVSRTIEWHHHGQAGRTTPQAWLATGPALELSDAIASQEAVVLDFADEISSPWSIRLC